ncbi:MAG TPA: DUF6379 domain-containing protein [Anaerolineales bacterium]|nr:DUF6379 domain-containing protein [Anaerolineales bacterium]
MGASVNLIRENSLQVVEDGYTFQIRLNWYRSLPVSSVDVLSLKLDGEPVPPDQIRFEINDHQYPVDKLSDQFEEFWFVQDFAGVRVFQPGKIIAGETHTLDAEIGLRIPYIAVGPGKFLTNITQQVATLVAN